MAISFPPELLGAVVAEVHSQSDLLQLRATNTTLNALATPLAFRSIQFANTDKSLGRFKHLARYPKIAELIHEVVYQYEEAEPNAPFREHRVRGFDGKAFVEALGLVSTLPALKELVFKFRKDDGPFKSSNVYDRDSPPEAVLQLLILRALGENEGYFSPLKSLTMDNLLLLPHSYLASQPMMRLLSTLTHFGINTTSQCAAFPTTNPRLELPSTFHLFKKEALSSSLVSLQLHHACVRSAEIVVPISKVHLPRLAYLSLQRTYFSEQGEVENFIARHGKTLVELKLFLCPMALSMRTNSSRRPKNFRRWAQVWNHLDGSLEVLKDLVVSERHDANGVEDVGLGRYIDNCYRCHVVDVGKEDKAADNTAFRQFETKVESRSQRP